MSAKFLKYRVELDDFSIPIKKGSEYTISSPKISIALEKRSLEISLTPGNVLHELKLANLFSNITKREFECLEFLSQGNTSKMTAKLLKLSPRTIERHFENIKEKLNIRYKSELINKYVEWKLLYKTV